MSTIDVVSSPGSRSALSEGSPFAGFWRRLLAFVIDILILGIGGMMLGMIFFDLFMQLGAWGRLLGFVIAMLYFGIQDSRLCGGQTLGKRWLSIRVVQKNGQLLSVGRAILRSSVVCIPYFLNNATLSHQIITHASIVISLLIFGLGLSLIYLYIFNRRTRQSLQDLAVGSYVVNITAERIPNGLQIWRGHYVVVALLLLSAMAVPLFAWRLSNSSPFKEMLVTQEEILNIPNVATAAVDAGFTAFHSIRGSSTTTSYIATKATLQHKVEDANSLANQIAVVIFDKIPGASEKDVVAINIRYGYDIGIASSWKGTNYAFAPMQWKKRLSR